MGFGRGALLWLLGIPLPIILLSSRGVAHGRSPGVNRGFFLFTVRPRINGPWTRRPAEGLKTSRRRRTLGQLKGEHAVSGRREHPGREAVLRERHVGRCARSRGGWQGKPRGHDHRHRGGQDVQSGRFQAAVWALRDAEQRSRSHEACRITRWRSRSSTRSRAPPGARAAFQVP
jgi:hypothetical protein